jgi:hypothetical protein
MVHGPEGGIRLVRKALVYLHSRSFGMVYYFQVQPFCAILVQLIVALLVKEVTTQNLNGH